jgi:FkbM family methyltransferase
MSVVGKLKTFLRLRAGLNLLKYRLGMPSQRQALNKLRVSMPEIGMVIDVGAAVGEFTELALSLWPLASVLAVEPRPEALTRLRAKFAANPRVHSCAHVLAARSGQVLTLKCAETASSVLEEHQPLDVPTLTIESMTLDDVMAANGLFAAKALLKIDVQGAELEVLRGATKTLADVRAVLVEMSLLDIHKGVPLAHEVMAWLAEHGFVMFELSDLIRRPLDKALWQIEALFVRPDDVLRNDKRWG